MSGEKTLCQRYCKDSIAGRPSALARAWQAAGYAGQARPGRLLCRAGAAGWRSAKPYDRMIRMIRMTRRAGVSGKNMFIRHVLRHVEIKRLWWLGAAEMRTRVALVLALVLKKLSVWQRILGEFQCRVFPGNPCIPCISLCRGGFPNGLYST